MNAESRLAALRRRMADDGLAAVLVTGFPPCGRDRIRDDIRADNAHVWSRPRLAIYPTTGTASSRGGSGRTAMGSVPRSSVRRGVRDLRDGASRNSFCVVDTVRADSSLIAVRRQRCRPRHIVEDCGK